MHSLAQQRKAEQKQWKTRQKMGLSAFPSGKSDGLISEGEEPPPEGHAQSN